MLEYHDAKGEFHKANYSEESAWVSRCHKQSAEKGKRQQITSQDAGNDVRNRGKHIAGWAFDPNWVKEGLLMASLVFDASKPTECPLHATTVTTQDLTGQISELLIGLA